MISPGVPAGRPYHPYSFMKAYAHSLRIAPKKANLIAKMVRGMSVPDAMEALRKTHKKAARMIELLLRSAIANTSHNDKQDAQMMVITSIVVNQGQGYRRGMPMARGRTRPFRKFLSHIDLELGFPNEKTLRSRSGQARGPKAAQLGESDGKASQKPKTAVKTAAKTQKSSPKKASETSSEPSSS